MTRRGGASLLVALLALLGACDDMADQPKRNAQESHSPSAGAAPREPEGTVSREAPIEAAPPVTLALLERGRQRFDIYCAPCHGRTGEGDGMIVQRGFPHPPSYHIDRLRAAPVRQFYEVITNGWGVMFPYATRVAPPDRWAIAAYIKALQASENQNVADLAPEEREELR